MELGIRQDSGDAETGFGMDLDAGILWSDPERTISGELRGRTLLTHILEFRDVFDMEGLVLQAGVLNFTNRGPSVDSSNPTVADENLDSVRGRTFFLRSELSW